MRKGIRETARGKGGMNSKEVGVESCPVELGGKHHQSKQSLEAILSILGY